MRIFILILAIYLSFVICNLSFGYRPFGTEDAGVAGRGVIQAEASFDYLKWGDGKKEGAILFVPIFGLTERIEFSCEIPYMLHNLQSGALNSGLGDINLVTKYLLPALTIKFVAKLDNGDFNSGHGSGDKDYSLFAVNSQTFGKLVSHAQLGYTFVGKAKNSSLRDIFLLGLGLDYELSGALHLVCEINGNRHPDSTASDDPRNWLAGFILKSSDKLLFDIGIRGGLSSASPDISATAGASVTL